jgi:hypothetical protein
VARRRSLSCGDPGPGCFKLLDALVFKQINHVVVVDSYGSDVLEHPMRVCVERADGVAADGSMVSYRRQGGLRHGVHHAVGNEVDDISGVVI